MTRILRIVVCMAALLPALPALAEMKVGIVDIAKVMEDSPQADQARKKLESEFAPRDQALVAAQKSLKDMEDRLATDGPIMSEEERRSLERDIIERKRDIRRSKEEFREDLNLRRNDELAKLQNMVNEAIESLAREERYDLILGPGVLFRSERVDITDKVLKRLREEFKRQNGRP